MTRVQPGNAIFNGCLPPASQPAPTSAQKLSHSTRLERCCAGSISSSQSASKEDTTPTRTPK